MNGSIHLDLDGAWPAERVPMETLPAREWGPRLRFIAPEAEIDAFDMQIGPELPRFVLFGSGDFHHLAGVLLRRVEQPVVVVSFDNHPDWDIRPPKWSCGGWINRALGLPQVQRVCVWGCGNFELAMPSRLFGNRRAWRDGRLALHAWAERYSPAVCKTTDCMSRENWRERFDTFCQHLGGNSVYITVDLDCLSSAESATNWEQGLFTASDIAWAISRLRASAQVIGGNLCGAYSPPEYARRFQRFAANWDHPKPSVVDASDAQKINLRALETIWPVLTGTTSG